MRPRLPHLAAVLLLAAAGTACWSDVNEKQATTTDSAADRPDATVGGAAQPATPAGGPAPSATDTLGGAPRDTGAGRAVQPGGTNAGARDTTSAARPPR